MKRRDLLPHLEENGCEFLREGGNHTIYVNRRAEVIGNSAASRDHRLPREKNLQRFGHSRRVTSSRSSRSLPVVAGHSGKIAWAQFYAVAPLE
jgi:hypothetical protein